MTFVLVQWGSDSRTIWSRDTFTTLEGALDAMVARSRTLEDAGYYTVRPARLSDGTWTHWVCRARLGRPACHWSIQRGVE